MPDQNISEYLAYLLASAHRRMRVGLSQSIASEDVTEEQWRILQVLSDEQGRSMGELAEVVLMNHPALTKNIDKLVSRGLVQRAADAHDSRKVLVVLVSAGGQVTHKVVEQPDGIDAAVLRQAASYVNAEFSGLRISEVREALLARLREERTLYDELLQRALKLAQSGLEEINAITPGVSLFIQGTSTLFENVGAHDERLSLDTLRSLFRMIEEKHRLVELLTQYIEAPGVTVLIGTENPSPDLHSFSVVASTYQDGDRIGAVGVIGPTRMRYQKSINVVDGVAQVVTRVFDTDTAQK